MWIELDMDDIVADPWLRKQLKILNGSMVCYLERDMFATIYKNYICQLHKTIVRF